MPLHYPRGFLLTKDIRVLESSPSDWQTLKLPGGWTFAYDESRLPQFEEAGNGSWVLVYGTCYWLGDDYRDASVTDKLLTSATKSKDAFLDALDMLTGRHVIVFGTRDELEIYSDATGARSIYYSREHQSVCSHARLLGAAVNAPPRSRAQGLSAFMANWDMTPLIGISALLPNHALSTTRWEPHRFYPRKMNRFDTASLAEQVAFVSKLWARTLELFLRDFPNTIVSITGGNDSRVVLAMARDYIHDLQAFTYTPGTAAVSTWSSMLSQDVEIVGQLLEAVPLNHRFFEFGNDDEVLRPEIAAAVARNTTGAHGRWLLPHYLKAFAGDDTMHMRGNAFEIARAYWDVTEANSTIDSLRTLFLSKTRKDEGYVDESSRIAMFEHGLAVQEYSADMYGYHLRDIYYWELRSGKWLAEVLNESDVAFDTFYPLNCRAMLDAALALPLQDRESGLFFSELINSNFPLMNFFGKNDVRNLYEQLRDAAAAERAGQSRQAHLGEVLIVDSGDDSLTVGVSDPASVYIPRNFFFPGMSISRSFAMPECVSNLRFEIRVPYQNRDASDTWLIAIYIDGSPFIEWDGATSPERTSVSVCNVAPSGIVSIVLKPQKDMRDYPSWSRASETTVTAGTIETGLEGAATVVACDNPYAIHCSG